MGAFITEEILSEGGISGTSISATTITAGIFYGDGANLVGVAGEFTGGTVTGATIFTGGLSANTFSATTLFGDGSNLTGISSSGGFTGGTVTGATNFTDGLSANTISATTITGTTLYGDGTNLTGVVPTSRTISTTSPLSGGGDLSVNRTISIQDAAADGTTKGAAAFTATDFNATTGVISIDYTNGQSASSTNKGFLTSADWTTFNSKANSFVSGATYSNNTFTFNNSTGGSFTVLFNTVTGLTVNGNLSVTGTTTSATISATTYQNLPLIVPRTINITYPTATENVTYFYTQSAYTIANLYEVVRGTSPSVTYNINYASARDSASPTKVFTADRTVTSTSGTTTSTFNNAAIGAGNWVWFTTSAAATGTTEITITISQ